MATARHPACDADAQELLDTPTRVGPVSAELAAAMSLTPEPGNDQPTKVFRLDSIDGSGEPEPAPANDGRLPMESGIVFHAPTEGRVTTPPVSGIRSLRPARVTAPPAPVVAPMATPRNFGLTDLEIVLLGIAVALVAVLASALGLF